MNLNDEQILPVRDTEGAVLVLAGAGSGKTRVLTARVAHLIEKGVPPWNILAITFTNKAAREMQERILEATGKADVTVCTFHSLCARILRREAQNLEGYSGSFSIYTDTDSARVVSEILKQKNLEAKEYKDLCLSQISKAKCAGLSPEDYISDVSGRKGEVVYEVFSAYENTLKASNALDFDDLLIKIIELFEKNRQILEKYQNKYRYIHVDEFQDTNAVQAKIAHMLAGGFGNLFVVGDDDQCIYTWRGADISNISMFKKRYPDCRIYKLERNYRSTKKILDAANLIIGYNQNRMGKTLWTDVSGGEKITYRHLSDDRAEADFIVSEINRLKSGKKLSDFAILVRVNNITRVIEERLTLYNIPYKIYGGFKFFERKEVKDVLAYLRLAVNPKDREALTRIINFPKRGIGDASVDKLSEFCFMRGLDLMDGLFEVEEAEGLGNAVKLKMIAFRDLLADLIKEAGAKKPFEFVKYLLEAIDIKAAFNEKDAEDASKLNNIGEFVNSVMEFETDNPDLTIKDYLEQVSLISSTDVPEEGDSVTLATIHGVKGLEFDTVFLAGLEENIFPVSRSRDDKRDLEEERRIMYVAVTRAKTRLYLTSAGQRFRFGKAEYNAVSRFVEETGVEIPSVKKAKTEYEDYRPAQYKPAADISNFQGFQRKTSFTAGIEKDISGFQVGVKVMHKTYQEGEITERNGDNAKIYFHGLGIKQFNLLLAPLEIIK